MKVCVISGSRADHAALIPIAEAFDASWVYVDTLASRNPQDSALSCAQAMMMAVDQLTLLKPDLAFVAGDRFEILGATIAAYLMGIPIAHISGGDVTQGSQDDSMRHAISKMAHIHFVSNEESEARLLIMGEDTTRIFNVGAPTIDYALSLQLLTLSEVEGITGITYPYILVAYQPATLIPEPEKEVDQLLAALKTTGMPCIFTTLNTDAGGIEIQAKIARYCRGGQGVILKMEHGFYLSVMKRCRVMVGNSSSGLYEAPSLGVPFVNIGQRQRGRIEAASVVSCPAVTGAIQAAIKTAMELNLSAVVNPYGDGRATERIKQIVEGLPAKGVLLQKGVPWPSTQPGKESTLPKTGVSTQRKNWSGGPAPSSPNQQESSTLEQAKEPQRGSWLGRALRL